jgi:hypothetical protein
LLRSRLDGAGKADHEQAGGDKKGQAAELATRIAVGASQLILESVIDQ